MKPGGWHALIPAFSTYLLCVWGFATITYNTIELPFLNMRKKYIRPESGPRSVDYVFDRDDGSPEANVSRAAAGASEQRATVAIP
jgi:hypothetical protein